MKILAFFESKFYVVCSLCSFNREQILSETSVFNLVTELFNIESKRQKEKLSFYVAFATYQKAFESEILLEYAKNSLNLYRAVPSKKYALLSRYVLKRLLALSDELRRHLDLPEASA